MSGSQPNYRDSYFQHPSLTKISGDLTYVSLVSSTLGGGLQGHLGLICSAATYDRVSPGVPFVRPLLPVLPDLTNSTAPQIAAARQLYEDELVIFRACNLIERTIIQQINTALDADCLADLIDDETGLLQGTIPDILQTLFDTYGEITPQTLAAEKAKVEATTYDHNRPIVNIFTDINAYAHMAEAAHSAETASQLINIGLIIITRSTIFSSDIRKWHDKPSLDQTWPNFKDHFKAAQKAIRKSQPVVTTDSLGFHGQANTAASLVDQVIERLTEPNSGTATAVTAETLAEQQMQQHIDNMANAAQQNQQMFDQMSALSTTVSTLQTQLDNAHDSGPRRGRNRNNDRGSRTNDRGGRNSNGRGPNNKRQFKYCWTHGNCAHSGTECETKADGHIANATYANMQGGSTTRCHWL
jgi:hypothetical protein